MGRESVSLQDNSNTLGPELRDRVTKRLGLSSTPAPDFSGLTALYGAWCANVPFDNLGKMIALRTGGDLPLPGMHAVEFFERWLDHGAGGTCWPTSNAFFELVLSLGFEAHRIAGCMRDRGIINHGSVRVTINGSEWLADASMHTNVPLPLNDKVFVSSDPVFSAEIEPVGATHIIWRNHAPRSDYMPCRLLADPVDHAYCVAAYEGTRMRGPFNQQLYARHCHPGEELVLLGHTQYSKTADGLQGRDLSSDEVIEALHEDIGISQELIEQWIRAGGLKATFEPTQGRKPPSIMQKPPSQR